MRAPKISLDHVLRPSRPTGFAAQVVQFERSTSSTASSRDGTLARKNWLVGEAKNNIIICDAIGRAKAVNLFLDTKGH